MRLIRSGAAVVVLAFAFAIPLAARAQETPPAGGEAKPDKPEKIVGVVKLDIDEKLDGKTFRDAAVTVRIRKKLREIGFKVWTEKPLYIDEYERKKKEKEAAKGGAAAPSATAKPAPAADERPAPDLVISGAVAIRLDRTSTFYGKSVAFMYASTIELSITDASGKSLAKITDKDEWGKTTEKEARDDEIRRTAAFAAMAVLKAEPVYGRLTPKTKASVDFYVGEVAKNHPRSPPEGQKPADGAKPEDGTAPGEGAGPGGKSDGGAKHGSGSDGEKQGEKSAEGGDKK